MTARKGVDIIEKKNLTEIQAGYFLLFIFKFEKAISDSDKAALVP